MASYRLVEILPEWNIPNILEKTPVTNPNIVSQFAIKYFKEKGFDPTKEYGFSAYFATDNRLIGFNLISIGAHNGTFLQPLEVFKPGICLSCHSIIVFHNHPSGSLKVSKQDIEITKKLKDASEILDINFLDHIILDLRTEKYISLHDQGFLYS